MSGGGGNNRQMPMASNRGQQMQNPQMGMQPQGMMGGQMPPYQMAQQMPPPGGMFGGRPVDMDPATVQLMQQAQQAQQMQGGMPPQAFDQFRQEEMMMGRRMDPMGRMPMQTNQPYAMPGQPMGDSQQMFDGRGIQDLIRSNAQNRISGNQIPYGSAAGQVGMGDMSVANQQPQQTLPSLPARSLPPAYGPTKGPIDGRKLRDMMNIQTRRPMDGLPGSVENTLPPSLKRPTQNRRG